MSYKSTINDARYSRLETEADQIKSELTLNPEMILYKDHSKGHRMILPNTVTDIKDQAKKYWDFISGTITSYSLVDKDLVINTIEL
jgi:hypothetical protein